MLKKIIFFLTFFLIIGCRNQAPQPKTIKQTENKTIQKVKKAFNNANNLEEKHSKWYNRKEKLPLTIIAVAYINPEVTNTKEYRIYKAIIKKIAKNPNLLGKNLSSKYSSIKFIDYDKNPLAREKFNAAYTHRYDDKEVLNDILRPDNEHSSQELLIRLNYNELKKGNLTIEGYKTVKQKNKLRNSYYYFLRKTNYKNLSDKEKALAMFNSIIATLKLSIPEYVSIDRNKLIKKDKVLRFVTPDENGTYQGEVWKYAPKNEIDKLKNKIIKNLQLQLVYTIKNYNYNYIYSTKYDISENGKYAIAYYSKFRDNKYIYKNNHTIPQKADYYMDYYIIYLDIENKKLIKTIKKSYNKLLNALISPDGKYALINRSTSSYNISKETFRVDYISLKTGKIIYNLYTSKVKWTNPVYSMIMSKNGKFAIIGADNTIKYINLKTGKTIKEFKNNSKIIQIAMSPDGKYALFGSRDRSIKYVNLNTGKTIEILKNNQKYRINSLVFSPTGRYAIALNSDKTLIFWDLKTGKITKKIHKYDINSIAINPKHPKYALSKLKNKLIYWNLDTKEIIQNIYKNTFYINFFKNGDYVLINNTIYKVPYNKKLIKTLYDKIKYINKSSDNIKPETKEIMFTTPLKKEDLIILKNNNYLNTTHINHKMILQLENILIYKYYDAIIKYMFKQFYSNKFLVYDKVVLIKPPSSIENLYFCSNFNLKEAGYTKTLTIKNINLNIKESKLKINTDEINSLSISKNNKILIGGLMEPLFKNNYGTLNYLDLKTGKTIKVLQEHKYRIKSVVFSPDGKYALFSIGNNIIYWDIKKWKTIKILKGHKYRVNSVVFSPDGKYALSGSSDKTIRYWDLKRGETIKILKGHTNGVNSVAISPDGRYALSGSYDKTLRYWDLKTGKTVKVLKGHTWGIKLVTFSPNGKYALSAGGDNTIRYWDLKTGKNIRVLGGYNWWNLSSIAFSPDGKYVIALFNDKKLTIWNLNTRTLTQSITLNNYNDGFAISPDNNYIVISAHYYTIKNLFRTNIIKTFYLWKYLMNN